MQVHSSRIESVESQSLYDSVGLEIELIWRPDGGMSKRLPVMSVFLLLLRHQHLLLLLLLLLLLFFWRPRGRIADIPDVQQ